MLTLFLKTRGHVPAEYRQLIKTEFMGYGFDGGRKIRLSTPNAWFDTVHEF